MKTQKEIVELASKAGYDRFHPQWAKNCELEPKSWFLELFLLQEWLREYCSIHLWVEYTYIDWDTYEYVYEIRYYPLKLQYDKRESERIKYVSSFQAWRGTYLGVWRDYNEAFGESIFKALNIIIKEKSI